MYYSQQFYDAMVAARHDECRRLARSRRAPAHARPGRWTAWLRRGRKAARIATVAALPIVDVEPMTDAA
jgi:hypothetical protein